MHPQEQTPPPPPSTGISRLAIASLVLGICTIIGNCFTGILAIVVGIMAQSSIRTSEGQLRGLVLAYIGIATGAILPVFNIYLLGRLFQVAGPSLGPTGSSARAHDAWPSNFDWLSPEVLRPDSQFKYKWTFNLNAPCPSACKYTIKLYVSADTTLDTESDHMFYSRAVDVGAGTKRVTSTTTVRSGGPWPLPADGTYYVFCELQPGTGAPAESNRLNNTSINPTPIAVKSR